ncbi:two-partner secretion system transporter CdrB, partial [Pseudomonas aeruginosa]
LDNRGSHYTDPTTLAFGATEFSRLGFYEQIDVLGAISPFSDATRYIQLRGTLPLGGMFAGDTLQIMGSYSKVNPDIPDSVFPFDSVSKSTEGSISYHHPFIRSRSQNLSGGLALQWKDTETRLRDFASDASNPGRDHVRVFQQRLTYDWVDRWMGINLAEVRNNIGLDMWGATKKDDERRSREVADGRFVYLNGNIGRLQGLGGPWSVYGELQWQYSFDPLLPSERFGVGGSGIGRGFAPGNITGDRGFALKLEPRYGQAVGYSWLRSYQAYAFYDWGKTYNLDVDDDEQQKLGSIGAGVRFNLTDQLSFNPEIARQVIGEPADQRDGKRETRVLFNVVARF